MHLPPQRGIVRHVAEPPSRLSVRPSLHAFFSLLPLSTRRRRINGNADLLAAGNRHVFADDSSPPPPLPPPPLQAKQMASGDGFYIPSPSLPPSPFRQPFFHLVFCSSFSSSYFSLCTHYPSPSLFILSCLVIAVRSSAVACRRSELVLVSERRYAPWTARRKEMLASRGLRSNASKSASRFFLLSGIYDEEAERKRIDILG